MPSYRIYKLANDHIAAVPEIVEYDSDDEVARYVTRRGVQTPIGTLSC